MYVLTAIMNVLAANMNRVILKSVKYFMFYRLLIGNVMMIELSTGRDHVFRDIVFRMSIIYLF